MKYSYKKTKKDLHTTWLLERPEEGPIDPNFFA